MLAIVHIRADLRYVDRELKRLLLNDQGAKNEMLAELRDFNARLKAAIGG